MSSRLTKTNVTGVVLDIEGTTTPVSFVYDVLFPYARARLQEYVTSEGTTDAAAEAIGLLRDEWSEDITRGEPVPEWPHDGPHSLRGLIAYLEWLMDRDRKSTGLKIIQGRIWEYGFTKGVLRGELFADVPRALERWRADGVTVAIYSSGSVASQRLIFGHSTFGDLTPFIARYFDTTVGAKRSHDSYARIAAALGRAPNDLVFISDVQAELDAASAAGFRTLLCVRSADAGVPPNPSPIIRTFDEID